MVSINGMKVLHLCTATTFALFAYWQLNDPDWLPWVLMYASVALTAIWSLFQRPPRWWVGLLLFVAAAWLLSLLPAFIQWLRIGSPTITGSMKAESPYIEYTREFLGLGICLLALGTYWRR